MKAILERTDRLVRNIGRRDHSKCTGNGCFESNLRRKTLRWKHGDHGLLDAVVHRGQVWRLWRPTKLGVMNVRILPVPRGLTVVAWCVVLLPHNWRWDALARSCPQKSDSERRCRSCTSLRQRTGPRAVALSFHRDPLRPRRQACAESALYEPVWSPTAAVPTRTFPHNRSGQSLASVGKTNTVYETHCDTRT